MLTATRVGLVVIAMVIAISGGSDELDTKKTRRGRSHRTSTPFLRCSFCGDPGPASAELCPVGNAALGDRENDRA